VRLSRAEVVCEVEPWTEAVTASLYKITMDFGGYGLRDIQKFDPFKDLFLLVIRANDFCILLSGLEFKGYCQRDSI
jgi:hypothetical protein